MKTKSLKTLQIETLVHLIVTHLGVPFKCNTYLAPEEDNIFQEDVSDWVVQDAWDLIYDESENETYDCQLETLRDVFGPLVEFLTRTYGPPTEMRDDQVGHMEGPKWVVDRVEKGVEPVWKYGRRGQGQLWITKDDQKTHIDVRYYYDKV